MGHSLTLDIPDEVYQPLVEKAQQAGQTPEALATKYLAQAVQGEEQDPLLRWAGAFSSEVTDLAERHDDYLGDGLLQEMRDISDG